MRSCLRWYVEDWELFLYGAYGSDCDWTLDSFLDLLGGEDMVGVVMRWLVWAMLSMALLRCAGAAGGRENDGHADDNGGGGDNDGHTPRAQLFKLRSRALRPFWDFDKPS